MAELTRVAEFERLRYSIARCDKGQQAQTQCVSCEHSCREQALTTALLTLPRSTVSAFHASSHACRQTERAEGGFNPTFKHSARQRGIGNSVRPMNEPRSGSSPRAAPPKGPRRITSIRRRIETNGGHRAHRSHGMRGRQTYSIARGNRTRKRFAVRK